MRLNFFIALGILSLFVSCKDEDILFNEYIEISNSQLSYLDTIVFQTNILDTSNTHNIFLQLRTSTDYKWSNMFVFSEINFPNSKTRTDTFEIILMDKKGHWKGWFTKSNMKVELEKIKENGFSLIMKVEQIKKYFLLTMKVEPT